MASGLVERDGVEAPTGPGSGGLRSYRRRGSPSSGTGVVVPGVDLGVDDDLDVGSVTFDRRLASSDRVSAKAASRRSRLQ